MAGGVSKITEYRIQLKGPKNVENCNLHNEAAAVYDEGQWLH